jgi:hypothetical protein
MLNLFMMAMALSGSVFAGESCFDKARAVTLNRIHEMMEVDAFIENAKISNLKLSVDQVTSNGQKSVTVYYSFDQTGTLNGPVFFSFIGELAVDPIDCSRTLSLPHFHQVEPLR